MQTVKLQRVTPEATKTLWLRGHKDTFWPIGERTLAGFQAFIESWCAAESMGWGSVRTVHVQQEDSAQPASADGGTGSSCESIDANQRFAPVGFVTFHELDGAWLPPEVTAVECGTYLLPQYRGTGLNRLIKSASASRAFYQLNAQFVLYAVPAGNEQALRSLRHILVNTETTKDERQLFSKWLRHREWKEGSPFELFAITLETAKACHLLNPDSDDGHLIRKQEYPHQDE